MGEESSRDFGVMRSRIRGFRVFGFSGEEREEKERGEVGVGLGGRRKKQVCWVVKWGVGFGSV